MLSLLIAIPALIFLTMFETSHYDTDVLDTIPTNFCLICLLMHMLAFFNIIWAIDIIGIILIIGLNIIHFYRQSKGRKGILNIDGIVEGFRNRTLIVVCVVFAVVFIGMHDRYIAGYDDLKFWGAQVKAFASQNGYGAPYTNICNRYGDYPLGSILIEYWFVRFCNDFNEGLIYIGQMIFSLSFVFPLLKKLRMNIISIILSSIATFSIGSAFTRFGIGLEPDRVMAIIYGGTLIAAYTIKKEKNKFNYIQFGLYLCCLCLIKSIGFLWAFFAVGFYFVLNYGKNDKKSTLKNTGLFAGCILLVAGTWNLYCYVFNRTTYLTQQMIAGLSMSPNQALEHIKSHQYIGRLFLEVVCLKDMNCSSFYPEIPWHGVALSPLGFIIVFSVFAVIMDKNKIKDIRKTTIYCLVICILYGLVLLWSYYFMFSSELNEDSLRHLQNMTSHYYEPAICGFAMIMMAYIIDYEQSLNVFKIRSQLFSEVILGIFLFNCVNIPLTVAFSYDSSAKIFHSSLYEVNDSLRNNINNELKDVYNQLLSVDDPLNSRILICNKDWKTVGNGYFCLIHYKISPISTIDYVGDLSVDELDNLIYGNHCNYAFVFSGTYDADEDLLKNYSGDDFKFDELIDLQTNIDGK